MAENMTCKICDSKRLGFVWTDRHGVGACINCNNSYRIYHYENDKRVDKPPECLVKEEWVPILRRYWEETKRRIPNSFVFTRSYDQCSEEDYESWKNWCADHADELPKTEDENG